MDERSGDAGFEARGEGPQAPSSRPEGSIPNSQGDGPGGPGAGSTSGSGEDSDHNSRFHGALRKRLSRQHYDTWFRRTHVMNWSPGVMVFGVPNRFYLEWIQNKFHATVIQAASELAQAPMQVAFEVAELPDDVEEGGGTEPPTPAPTRDVVAEGTTHADSPPAPTVRADAHSSYAPEPFVGSGPQDLPLHLNPHYTFKNFIRGPSNSVAYASAEAVALRPGKAYNPLFIHGSVGLGKTHLLHAACRQFQKGHPRDRICFLSCEQFTNEFVRALKTGEHQRFRDRFRSVHLLVIDDIHFLEGKERTQEEFFHTFNQLYQSNRQIVLSSDAAPNEIPTLEDRLVSRFGWGLVTQLEQPEMETRMAIVRRKAELMHIDVPNDVVEFIASHFRNNIRELEGALLSTRAYADVLGEPVSLRVARAALKQSLQPVGVGITIDKITQLVCERFEVKLADLRSKRRSRSISEPRQIIMFLARRLTSLSLDEIGDFFGGRDHSTVLYGVRKVEELYANDPTLAATLERMADRLGGRLNGHEGRGGSPQNP